MSQRECAGFNWPRLSVDAGEPLSAGPPPASATVLRLLSVFPASLFPFCAGVPAIGVGHAAARATEFRETVAFDPSGLRPVTDASFPICDPVALPTVGDGHTARCEATVRSFAPLRSYSLIAPAPAPAPDRIDFTPSSRFVVGHEVDPVAPVRGAEARSRKNDRPAGVTQTFQVRLNSVEPSVAVL